MCKSSLRIQINRYSDVSRSGSKLGMCSAAIRALFLSVIVIAITRSVKSVEANVLYLLLVLKVLIATGRCDFVINE